MSEGLNKVMFLGNLGQDPELRQAGNTQVCKMRVAATETYFDANKQKQERTEWATVSIFGARGEALARILSKGSRIYAEGRLHTSSYEKNGEKRFSTEIVASNVILLDGKRGEATAAPKVATAPAAEPSDADDSLPF